MSNQPSEPPPPYAQATGSQTSQPLPHQQEAQSQQYSQQQHQQQSQTGSQPVRNESEHDLDTDTRVLPPGWIVQLDESTEHYFFVDTRARPPRSIWTHPSEDAEWLQQVPEGQTADEYAHELWAREPDQPGSTSSQSSGPRVADQLRQEYRAEHGNDGPSRQPMQQPAQPQQDGKRVIKTRQELVEYVLSKMGTPEEYERKNPAGSASKLFHRNETPRERQRRHAENKARDILDQAAMQRSMTYSRPTMAYGGYGGYPAYGRGYGYGGYGGGMYGNRMGMGMGGFGMPLGLGMGAGLLGGSMLAGGFGGGYGGDFGGGGGDCGGGGGF